jgi:hypothetical protein
VRISIKQADGSRKSWDYDERMSLKEAMTIKAKLGLTVLGFTDGLAQMDPYALAGLIWLVRSRDGEPELDPRLIDFDLGDLDIEDPDAAAKDAAAEVEADPPVPPEAAPQLAPVVAASTTPTPPAEADEPVVGAAV